MKCGQLAGPSPMEEKKYLEILFSQLLEVQSQALKGQNEVEFNFKSIFNHHISLWRGESLLFGLLAKFVDLLKEKSQHH